MGESQFDRAIEAIDAANAGDPATIVVGGVPRPKEQTHAEMMTAWVRRLDPGAADEQLLAARAAHLRRWELPRASYPDGRAGYLRWRRDAKERHAEAVGSILTQVGYGETVVERVGRIVRKEGLRDDPAVQTHEDALCLVFLETQALDLAADLGADKTVAVLRKTLAKMSARGVEAALALPLPDAVRALLGEAVA